MPIPEELSRFVRKGLGQGLARDQMEAALLETGWRPEQVRGAMAAYADVTFPIPVPRPKPSLSAREAFVYLVIFSTLYTTAFSLGNLIFELINQAFPDPAMDPQFMLRRGREVIRWSISFLVVAFPAFVLVTRSNERTLANDPARRLSAVRRWLTYATLFIAGAFLLGDATAVVYNVLSGETTVRFFLKVATVAAIAGSVFFYLVHDLRRGEVAS